MNVDPNLKSSPFIKEVQETIQKMQGASNQETFEAVKEVFNQYKSSATEAEKNFALNTLSQLAGRKIDVLENQTLTPAPAKAHHLASQILKSDKDLNVLAKNGSFKEVISLVKEKKFNNEQLLLIINRCTRPEDKELALAVIQTFQKSKESFQLYLWLDTQEIFQKDKEIALAFFDKGIDIITLLYPDSPLCNDKEVMMRAILLNPNNFRSAGVDLRGMKDFVKFALSKGALALDLASKSLQNDPEIVKLAVKNSGLALKYASKILKADFEIVLAAVEKSGSALEYADVSLQNHPYIVLRAVKQQPYAFKYASDPLKGNEKIAYEAVKGDPSNFEFASESLRNNEKIAREALTKRGNLLKFAGPEIKKNRSIVKEAMAQSIQAFEHADPSLKDDPIFIREEVKKDGRLFEFLGPKFKSNRELLLLALREGASGTAIKFASKELKKDTVAIVAALRRLVGIPMDPETEYDRNVQITLHIMFKKSNALSEDHKKFIDLLEPAIKQNQLVSIKTSPLLKKLDEKDFYQIIQHVPDIRVRMHLAAQWESLQIAKEADIKLIVNGRYEVSYAAIQRLSSVIKNSIEGEIPHDNIPLEEYKVQLEGKINPLILQALSQFENMQEMFTHQTSNQLLADSFEFLDLFVDKLLSEGEKEYANKTSEKIDAKEQAICQEERNMRLLRGIPIQ